MGNCTGKKTIKTLSKKYDVSSNLTKQINKNDEEEEIEKKINEKRVNEDELARQKILQTLIKNQNKEPIEFIPKRLYSFKLVSDSVPNSQVNMQQKESISKLQDKINEDDENENQENRQQKSRNNLEIIQSECDENLFELSDYQNQRHISGISIQKYENLQIKRTEQYFTDKLKY